MKWLGWGLWIAASLTGYLFLYATARTEGTLLVSLWGGLIMLYGFLMRARGTLPFALLLSAAVLFRLLAMVNLPTLSDDVYRFIWDGRLLAPVPTLRNPGYLTGLTSRTHGISFPKTQFTGLLYCLSAALAGLVCHIGYLRRHR